MEEKPEGMHAGGGGSQVEGHIAADTPDTDPSAHEMIPVWFFVGVILLIYGVIILITGISELSSPPLEALANMPTWAQHPATWWGALLTVVGAIYVYLYMPKKSK